MGRNPNVEGLGLEEAKVDFDLKGIKVDSQMCTSNSSVFAVGDCLNGPKFTHNSDIQARYVIRNTLFFGKAKKSSIILPRCTYTDPEISSVGMNE